MEVLQSNQILVPKQIYIGDRAELHCSFNSDAVFLRNALMDSSVVVLDQSGFARNIEETQFEVTHIQLQTSGANYYTLVISFIPWKTGRIEFPEYDIGTALRTTEAESILRFEPIQVTSLIEGETTSIREAENPMLLPGTVHKLWLTGISLLILIAIIIRVIVKRKDLALFFKNQKLLRKYRKNKKQTEKVLYKLMDDTELPSHDVAEEIQKVVRNYLEIRFDHPFTHLLTSELMNGFYKATLHLLSPEKEDAFIGIANTFVRTDFIRYSKDASFKGGEKEEIIAKIIRNIEIIEAQEPDKSPDYDENEGESNA